MGSRAGEIGKNGRNSRERKILGKEELNQKERNSRNVIGGTRASEKKAESQQKGGMGKGGVNLKK